MPRATFTVAAGIISLLLVPLAARQLPSSGDTIALLASGDQLASEARFGEALAAYRQALALSGEALWAAGLFEAAEADFERALSLDPDHARAGLGRSHTVTFRMSRDKVIVSGKVNGGREIDFVLDTGSEQTVLSRPVAERSGVRPITYVQSAGVGQVGMRALQAGRINTLEIGSLKVRNVPALIKSPALGGLPTPEAESFSPLALGLSMTIDYGRRELTMATSLPDGAFDLTMPLRMHRLAMVSGIVGHRFLRDYRVSIDLPRARLGLTPLD